MLVSLNLKPVQVPDGLATFGDLIRFIESERIPQGQVITQVLLDGRELSEQDELVAGVTPCAGIGKVDLFSARAIDLAQEGLADATRLLPELAQDLPAAAAELGSGDVETGLERFSSSMEVISWYVNLVSAVDDIFHGSNGEMKPGYGGADGELSPEESLDIALEDNDESLVTFASVENLRQKLLDVNHAQEKNDTMLLADLIEYEILPIVRIWIVELPFLITRTGNSGGSA